MTVAIFGHRGYPARFPENTLNTPVNMASMGLKPMFR